MCSGVIDSELSAYISLVHTADTNSYCQCTVTESQARGTFKIKVTAQQENATDYDDVCVAALALPGLTDLADQCFQNGTAQDLVIVESHPGNMKLIFRGLSGQTPGESSFLLKVSGKEVSYHCQGRTQAHTHARTHARTHAHTHARTHARDVSVVCLLLLLFYYLYTYSLNCQSLDAFECAICNTVLITYTNTQTELQIRLCQLQNHFTNRHPLRSYGANFFLAIYGNTYTNTPSPISIMVSSRGCLVSPNSRQYMIG